MSGKRSRRDFLKTTGSGAAIATLGVGSGCSSDSEFSPEDLDQPHSQRMSRKTVESEIRRRADFYLSQRYMVVDYYRIRRKLAYPLPVRSVSVPEVSVPSIDDYPWTVWMTWELEERVNSLGWAAEWFGDEGAQEAVAADLVELARWPEYRQYERPDLSAGHVGRILWTACTKWSWVDAELRNRLVAGCRRHLEEVFPASEHEYGQISSVADIRALEEPHRKLHNIPLIGTIGAALVASCSEQSAVSTLNHWIQTIFEANLDFREGGFTEGVAYDGYVLDFIADWFSILSEEQRLPILKHRFFTNFLEESYMLSVPGAPEMVAELGDVEPKEMPFHISAQAKIYPFQPDPVRAWHLKRWRADWIRSGGLGALHTIVDELDGEAPVDGVSNAHYAVVLRNGWDQDGLSTVVSCNNSPMGHLQKDNGTILVGKAGRWLITDPGYQQYMEDLEREFTLGPTAHNYPVINGLTQSQKSPRLLALETISKGVHKAAIDLTSCYPEEAKASAVIRTVWLSGNELVTVADQIDASTIDSLQYHWQGHPEASWWCQDGWALIHTDRADLWMTSPQFTIAGSDIKRFPGSRGQLTLSVETASPANVVWWFFVLAETFESFHLMDGGKSVEILGQTFGI